jgi:hypothetical protein
MPCSLSVKLSILVVHSYARRSPETLMMTRRPCPRRGGRVEGPPSRLMHRGQAGALAFGDLELAAGIEGIWRTLASQLL